MNEWTDRLTVSPVRHVKDGLVENSRSKASLLLAVDELLLDGDDATTPDYDDHAKFDAAAAKQPHALTDQHHQHHYQEGIPSSPPSSPPSPSASSSSSPFAVLPPPLSSSAAHIDPDQRRPQTSYFPSYELLMDDLRDYRFYDRDMIHPSQVCLFACLLVGLRIRK